MFPSAGTSEIIGNNLGRIRSIIGDRKSCLDHQAVLSYQIDTINRNLPIVFHGNDMEQSIKARDYEIVIYGILPCGSKTALIIEGVYPYLEIKCTESVAVSQKIVDSLLVGLDIEPEDINIVSGRDFMGYSHEQSKYIKILFRSLKDRESFAKLCKKRSIKTYSNDGSAYYRVAARDHGINLCGWNEISKYRKVSSGSYKTQYTFRCDVADINPIDVDSYTKIDRDILRYDNTIVSAFDIEMCPASRGAFPDADVNPNDTIFMIAQTFHFCKKVESVLNVVITIKDSAPIDDAVILVVDSEKTLLLAFAQIYNLMQPDFITEFNGGGFDWRNIMTKVVYHKITEEFLTMISIRKFEKWELDGVSKIEYTDIVVANKRKPFRDSNDETKGIPNVNRIGRLSRFYDVKSIKTGGASADAIYRALKLPGYVEFDTMVVFKQLKPNAESHSLNECLASNNLGSKDELPTMQMFDIYLNGSRDDMTLVSHYCLIDTVKLQCLLIKQNVIQDRREVCILSYTNMCDGFLYANGLKVRNLIMNKAIPYNLKFDTTMRAKAPCGVEECKHRDSGCYYSPNTTKSCDKVKYPGAYVVPPTKGVVAPMLRFDEFVSKNSGDGANQISNPPDMDLAFEFIQKHYDDIYVSPDDEDSPRREFDESEFEKLDIDRDTQIALEMYIEYTRKNENRYPISGLDFSSLYPSIIMTYNLSPEYLVRDAAYASELESMGKTIKYISFPFGGEMINAWFVCHDNNPDNYGICARALIDLFNARAELKKVLHPFTVRKKQLEMMMNDMGDKFDLDDEYNDVCFNFNYYDSKQKALKVFMNTFYGQMGNLMSFICAVEVAGSVTTLGRYNLMLAKNFVETEFKVRTYYGDSVTHDTPVYLKHRSSKFVTAIEAIVPACMFVPSNEGKEIYIADNEDISVYSETGFVKVSKIIRHRTNKKMYRVSTSQGFVDVTEDHSLISSSGDALKPTECVVGTNLLTCDFKQTPLDTGYQSLSEITQNMTFELQQGTASDETLDTKFYLYGLFYAFGRIYNGHLEFNIPEHWIEMIPESVLADKSIEKMRSTRYIHRFASDADLEMWEIQHYDGRYSKRVPEYLVRCSKSQLMCYLFGAFGHNMLDTRASTTIEVSDSVSAQILYLALSLHHYKVTVHRTCLGSIRITMHKSIRTNVNDGIIEKIEFIGYTSEYVYDLETDTHHFSAGVGNLVVHNTDSLYIACNEENFSEYNKLYFASKMTKLAYATKLVEVTFIEIEKIKIGVNNALMSDNGSKFLKMAYEEVLFPVVFLGKKKYYGTPHEEVVDFYPKKPFIRGVDSVRRGKSGVLKDIAMGIMRGVIDIHNVYTVLELVNEAIKRYFTTEWEINYFVKTAVYRPQKENISVHKFMGRMLAMKRHVELMNKGPFAYSIPEPNVRFRYAIVKRYPWEYDIKGNQISISVGDRMELIERIINEKLEIDLNYYFEHEITGQLARMIAYDDMFDTYDRSKFEADATDDDKLKCIDDEMFKNCKKYIENLASSYSPEYHNKGKLYKSTTKRVEDIIVNVNNKKMSVSKKRLSDMPMLSSTQSNAVIDYFTQYTIETVLARYSTNPSGLSDQERGSICESHFKREAERMYDAYKSKYNSNQLAILFRSGKDCFVKRKLASIKNLLEYTADKMSRYLKDQKIEDSALGFTKKSTHDIVMEVRDHFNFQKICDDNVAEIEVIDDIVPFQELERIVCSRAKDMSMTEEQANAVLDMTIEMYTLVSMRFAYERLGLMAIGNTRAAQNRYDGKGLLP